MPPLRSILLLLLSLSAGQAAAADLLEIYHAAQSQDAVFAAARATQRAGYEKRAQGRSLLLPSISLSANDTLNKSDIRFGGAAAAISPGSQNYNSYGFGLNLVQPLYHAEKNIAYSQAELQVALSETQFNIVKQDLILRVAQAYFDVLAAHDAVQLGATQKAAISEQLEQAKRNFDVGTATITDSYEAQARYDLVNAQEIAAQSNLEIKKRAMQQITRSALGELRPLSPAFKPKALEPTDVERWVDLAQQSSLQLASARVNTDLAEQEVARNRAGHSPTVDLVANYGQSYANASSLGVANNARVSALGVQLNLPLYQGGAINSKVREAEANLDRSRDELDSARRNVTLQTSQAYLGVVNGLAQVRALQQALRSGESVLEASKLGQEVGVRTNLDVLNAQQQLYATRRDFYQAEYNYLLSQLQLKAATGKLSEEDLAVVNQALY